MGFENLNNKRILILGFAREGRDNLSFLRTIFPKKKIGIADKKSMEELPKTSQEMIADDPHINLHLGEKYLAPISKYNVIFKTPGIPFKELEKQLAPGTKITSQANIFLKQRRDRVIGVTGTKGKSTTSSLIYEILDNAGINVHLIGNIGKPVLSFLSEKDPDALFVYELSSHQLANIEVSPHIAVFLNIFKEHLDYYKDFNDYVRAKTKITQFQNKNDFLIFNREDKGVKKIADGSRAQKISIAQKINLPLKTEEIPLRGDFYLLNIRAAAEVGRLFNISESKIANAVKNFKPLAHRLEYVGQYQGIHFYNDSLATIPEATINAIEALNKKTQTIILGGFERKQDYKALVEKIAQSKIENIILFPSTGKRIKKLLQKTTWKGKIFEIDNMREAIKICFQNTKSDKICLLSPAAPSFGIFKDYKERGELFKKWVKHYAKKTTN